MHVLIATDGSQQSVAAAQYLKSFTDPSTVDKVSVLAVVSPLAAVPFATDSDSAKRGGFEDLSFRKSAEGAAETVAEVFRGWAPSVSTHVWSGSPAGEIVRAAKQMKSGLIVIASQSSRAESVLMGSVAHRVLNLAPCPVLVVRPGQRRRATKAAKAKAAKASKAAKK